MNHYEPSWQTTIHHTNHATPGLTTPDAEDDAVSIIQALEVDAIANRDAAQQRLLDPHGDAVEMMREWVALMVYD